MEDRKFRENFEKSPIGIVFYDKEGKLTDANQSALKIAGIPTLDDIIGFNLFDDVHIASKKDELLEKGSINIQIPFNYDNIKKLGFYNPTRSGTAFIDLTISIINSGFLGQIQDITERKKVEESLKESEERYHDFFNNPIVGLGLCKVVVNENGEPIDYIYLEVNDAFKEFTGLKREKIINKGVREVLPDDADNLVSIFGPVGINGGRIKVEVPIPTLGRIYEVDAYSPIKNHFIAIFRDITERKEHEAEIQTLFEYTPAGMVLFDAKPPYTVLVHNKYYQEFFAEPFRSKGMVGLNVYDYAPEVEAEGVVAVFDEVVRTKKAVKYLDFPYKSNHPNESWFDWYMLPVIVGGKVISLVSMSIDVTARHKMEEELRVSNEELRQAHDYLEEQVEKRTVELKKAYNSLQQSELKFKTLAENSPDIINRMDKEFKNVYINPVIINISGRPPEYFIGKKMNELGIPEEFTVPLIEKAKKVFETGMMDEFVTEMPTIKGLRTFYTYLAPEYDENGETNTVLSVSHDITEIKQTEKQLKETITELERSNEELQSFAYITSHDLQEPLRTMGNYAGLLKKRYEGQLDPDADDFLDFMASGAARMKDMVQGLLDYSRVGTQGKEFREFSAEKALDNALTNLKTSTGECHAEITYDSLPEIVADESQITRVFQNLIGNALKFHREGIQPKIHISAQEKDDEYVFSVSDNGIGIEEQYSDKIFEIFKRLHAIGEYHGAGIGLAIVNRIIDRHGGRVWVESEFGKGSTFYFTIPIKIND